MTTLFTSLSDQDKQDAVKNLIADSTPRDEFFLMIVLSVFMATFGLLSNNASVIIGSMLIAPLLSPILGFSMGIVMAEKPLISRSIFTLVKSLLFALPASAIVALFFSGIAGLGPELNPEIISRLKPDVISGLIALVAGFAASYALIRPKLSASLPGVAVAASLIPPVAVAGIGIARLDWGMISNSLVLFLVNIGLILFASSIVFSLMRLFKVQPIAHEAIKREAEKLKKDQAIAKEMEKN